MSETSEYLIWGLMKNRCTNKNAEDYERYGARGIFVCKRWVESFENFFEDMGKRPSKKYSIDRINNDDGYYKENCRWATATEQANNKRISKNAIVFTHNGKTMCLRAWSREIGMNYETLTSRIKVAKMSFDQAINKPLKK